MGSQAKHWVFTLNNWTQNEQAQIISGAPLPDDPNRDNSTFKYLVIGRETGANGTPHLQGFLTLRTKLRLRQVKALAGFARAHLEISRGTPAQASTYCKKDGDFDEFGELATAQGKRCDWERLKEYIKEQDQAPTTREVAELFPSLVGRYPNQVQNFIKLFGKAPRLVEGTLRPWQEELNQAVSGEPDDRQVRFIVDSDGRSGKSWLTRYWFSHRDDIQVLSIGKRDDLAFAIDETKKLFVFDIPRGSMEFLQYSVLEQLKDQLIFSPKYQSQSKVLREKVHVVVFCNEDPDMCKMTEDRYNITQLRNI